MIKYVKATSLLVLLFLKKKLATVSATSSCVIKLLLFLLVTYLLLNTIMKPPAHFTCKPPTPTNLLCGITLLSQIAHSPTLAAPKTF